MKYFYFSYEADREIGDNTAQAVGFFPINAVKKHLENGGIFNAIITFAIEISEEEYKLFNSLRKM